MHPLHRHPRLRIPRRQRIHIRQRHIAGAVCSEGGFIFAADDGEGVEDVFGVVSRQAVEVEVERVEAGAEVAAFLFVPDEGLAVVAEVAGEGGHVVGGVREAEDVVADEIAGGCRAEGVVVVGGGDDGELFDDEPTQICPWHFVARHIIEAIAVEIRNE